MSQSAYNSSGNVGRLYSHDTSGLLLLKHIPAATLRSTFTHSASFQGGAFCAPLHRSIQGGNTQ
jgi:hypothetical protein